MSIFFYKDLYPTKLCNVHFTLLVVVYVSILNLSKHRIRVAVCPQLRNSNVPSSTDPVHLFLCVSSGQDKKNSEK